MTKIIGWTVGAWSITQKGNFKDLGETYMSKYGFSAKDCKTIIDSDPGNGTPSETIGNVHDLVKRLTNNSPNSTNEEVINFIRATTDMWAHRWYKSMLDLINKLGFKTRLGIATVIRAVGWTGGDPGPLIDKPTRILTGGAGSGNIYEMGANFPFGDIEKEKKFIKLWWEGHKLTGAKNRGYYTEADAKYTKSTGGVHGWINESNSYINALAAGNENADSVEINGNKINYGELPSGYAQYKDIIMPYFREVGSPITIGSTQNTIISDCDVLLDPGHTKSDRGDDKENKKYPFYFNNATINSFYKRKLTAIYGNANVLTPIDFRIEYYTNVIMAKDLQIALKSLGLKVSYIDFPDLSGLADRTKIKEYSAKLNPRSYIAIHQNAHEPGKPRENMTTFIRL